MTTIASQNTIETEEQYSLAKIMGIWALVALPMPVVIFIIAPALVSRVTMNPGLLIWLLVIGGYIWQFMVSLFFIYDDIGTLKWSAVRERIWLKMPRDPHTNEPKAKLFWWLIPALLFVLLIEIGLGDYIDSAFAWLFPGLLTLPASIDIEQIVVPEFIGGLVVTGCCHNQ